MSNELDENYQEYDPELMKPSRASIKDLIRHKTNNGFELVHHAVSIMRGTMKVEAHTKEGVAVDVGPNIKERMDAIKWLADRGFGKVGGPEEKGKSPLEGFSEDQLKKILHRLSEDS